MKLLRNIAIPIDQSQDLEKVICQKLNLASQKLVSWEVTRRSLDARRRNHLVWQYNALVEISGKFPQNPDLLEYKEKLAYINPNIKLHDIQPVIIGAGPAGLFAALILVEKGYKPLLYDQGEPIPERDEKVKQFWQKGILDTESNIQNGEGGAGTYSDGKLTSRNQDFYTTQVYKYLIKFGADPDILINSHPHLGTDKLKKIITSIREYLEQNGCRFFWKHKLERITIKNGKVSGVFINGEKLDPEIVILAPGNSARDLFKMLTGIIPLQNRSLAVGFRIEHEQEFINALFYGDKTDTSLTGAGEYRIKVQLKEGSVYSFCMCPGGIVVNASSNAKGVVTNGMSWSKRKGKYSNAAIVTSINVTSESSDALAGVRFQEMIEQKCFKLSESYLAPAQKAEDFIKNRYSKKPLKTTFLPDSIPADLNKIYNPAITGTIKEALSYWDKRYKGFASEGTLLAPETRTSSPVRIIRKVDTWESEGADNLYPIGEGAGYSGGIISSAAEGIKLCAKFEYFQGSKIAL
ncbi:MAG: hypothetical protein RAO94_12140 [Candidatus Stygibacter australis]|nr:hypothetical protein [Candidatus Stygibacter australis]MDP8323092.1 hypothetical protein [Candidatus Stygibacter australis]